MQTFFLSSECKVYLKEIRRSIIVKKENTPMLLSADEFDTWKTGHNNYYLHKGYLSIWNDIAVPEDAGSVVVEKRTTRENVKPFLVFEDQKRFREYCRHAHLLGMEAYAMLESKFSKTIKTIANMYSASLSSCDKLQEEAEKFTGLNFKLEDTDISDEELYASLYNYLRKTISQKAYTIFKAQGVVIDVDISDLENLLSADEEEFIKSITYASVNRNTIDLRALLCKISGLIEDLSSDKATKYDIKDNLLIRIVRSDRATGEFILYHYSSLNGRKSVWRPIAFSFQIQYSHDNGEKYMKNPVYVQSCSNIIIGEMISNQLKIYSNSAKTALSNMNYLASKAKEERVYHKPLVECAENAEQIGKALSKELRTEEAKSALARALLVVALEMEQAASFNESKGDGNNERSYYA